MAATSKFIKYFQTTGGTALTGAAIWLVPQSIGSPVYPTDYLSLTAHSTRTGVYYRNAVTDGEYKIYIDTAGGTSPVLYESNLWVGEERLSLIAGNFDSNNQLKLTGMPDFLITNRKIAPNSVSLDKLSFVLTAGTENLVDGAVWPDKTTFFTTGKNLYNAGLAQLNKSVDFIDGGLFDDGGKNSTPFINVDPSTAYTSNYLENAIFYTSDQLRITGSGIHNTSGTSYTFTTPSNAAYVRFSYSNSHSNIQLELGASVTSFESFRYYIDFDRVSLSPIYIKNLNPSFVDNVTLQLLSEQLSIKSVPANTIADNVIPGSKLIENTVPNNKISLSAIDPDRTTFLIPGKNLYNPGLVISNKAVDYIDGGLFDSTGKSSTPFINILSSTQYTANYLENAMFYTADKTHIAGSGIHNIAGTSYTFTTPSNAVYVVFSYSSSHGSIQLELGTSVTGFESFRYYLDYEKASTFPIYIKNLDGSVVDNVTLQLYTGQLSIKSIPSNLLPSYVDDVLEFANLAACPSPGETGKIYVALDTNKCYRWSGSAYIEVSPSIGTDVTTMGALINSASEKTTPVDTDMTGLMDSGASNVLKKLSWTNIKATLKTYFDSLYLSLSGNAASSTKSTNLAGGNSTTLLGSIPYQSNTDTSSLLSPNTTTTKKFLRQTGNGTNGAAPAWDTVTNSDVGLGSVTNDAQLKVADLDTSGTLTANSDTKIPSQKAVKTYVDAHTGSSQQTSIVYKSSNQTVNNSSTLQNDNDLFIAISASTVYNLELVIFGQQKVANASMICSFTAPSGVTLNCSNHYSDVDGTFYNANTTTLALVSSWSGVNDNQLHVCTGILIVGSTAGTLQLQWAQSTARSGNTIFLKGSYLKLTKVS